MMRWLCTMMVAVACIPDLPCEDQPAWDCGEGCRLLPGRLIVDVEDGAKGEQCVQVAPESLACFGDVDCGSGLTYATNPDGAIYEFSSTCIPRDFTEVDDPGVEDCEDPVGTTVR